jgi:hypothetical protein
MFVSKIGVILRWAGTGSLLAARFGGSRFQNGCGSGEDSGCALVGNFLFGFQPVLNLATTEVGAIVPKGNTVYGRLSEAKQAGRVTGSSELQLETHRQRCRRHVIFVAGLGIGYFARGALSTNDKTDTDAADLAAIEELHKADIRATLEQNLPR